MTSLLKRVNANVKIYCDVYDVDDVKSISYQYRRYCDVDIIDLTMGTGQDWGKMIKK